LTRAAIKVILLVVAALLAWRIVAALSDLLLVLATSLFITLAMEPPVNFLVKKHWKRGLASGVVLIGIVLGAIGLVAAFGQLFIGQLIELVKSLPNFYADVAGWLQRQFDITLPTQNEALSQLTQRWGDDLAGNALSAGVSLFSVVISLLGVLLITYYLSARGPQFRAAVCSPLKPKRQKQVLEMWAVAQSKTAAFLYSRVIMALASAIVTYIVLLILRIPYALPLALFVGIVSQFVPTIGTYIAGAAPVLVALLESPVKGIVVLVFFIAYQQVENLIIGPKLTSITMEINPAVAFVSVIALGTVIGPIGAFLSLPAVATGQAIVSTYIRRYDLVQDDLLMQDTLRMPRKRMEWPDIKDHKVSQPGPGPSPSLDASPATPLTAEGAVSDET